MMARYGPRLRELAAVRRGQPDLSAHGSRL